MNSPKEEEERGQQGSLKVGPEALLQILKVNLQKCLPSTVCHF